VLLLFCSFVVTQGQVFLWNQQDTITNSGFGNTYFTNVPISGTTTYPGIEQSADDFNIPAGVQWQITEVGMNGFYSVTTPITPVPTAWTIQILGSTIGSTGEVIPGPILIQQNFIPQGGMNSTLPIFTTVNPIVLNGPGKYWLSIFATIPGNGNQKWFAFARNTTNGYFQGTQKLSYKENDGSHIPSTSNMFNIYLAPSQLSEFPMDELFFAIIGTQVAVATSSTSLVIQTQFSTSATKQTSNAATIPISTTHIPTSIQNEATNGCYIGALGCYCTGGNGCDPGLTCQLSTSICVAKSNANGHTIFWLLIIAIISSLCL